MRPGADEEREVGMRKEQTTVPGRSPHHRDPRPRQQPGLGLVRTAVNGLPRQQPGLGLVRTAVNGVPWDVSPPCSSKIMPVCREDKPSKRSLIYNIMGPIADGRRMRPSVDVFSR